LKDKEGLFNLLWNKNIIGRPFYVLSFPRQKEKNMPALKEWMPRKRLSHKDGVWHLARAHKASLKGKNDRTKDLALVLLYQRKFTRHIYSGLSYKELAPLLGDTIGKQYLEDRLLSWTEKWHYLKREPAIDPVTRRMVFLYAIDDRGRNMVENIIPRQKLAEYIAILIDAHKKLLLAQKEAKPSDNVS
jgi:hypothetical protein